MTSPRLRNASALARLALVVVVALLALPAVPTATLADSPEGTGSRSMVDPSFEWHRVDEMGAVVMVPPGEVRVLRINHTTNRLEPVDWPDPLRVPNERSRRAVEKVEPWLRLDLAAQLRRLGTDSGRFADLVNDCPDDRYVDEIAFSIAHTPPEVLRGITQEGVLTDNARYLYQQDMIIDYADLVERRGDDGNYTTVRYLNGTGEWWELPRDEYYWYLAHARVFWEIPSRAVGGKSFWRKAFFDELEYQQSGTLKDHLTASSNVVEAIQGAVLWNHLNMEFGYGTNPLQPVEIIQSRYGSCGQFSIIMAAAFKVAMVPARVSIYTASDHQWNEVFMNGMWYHIDAAGDNAGSDTRAREPEVINKTGTGNLNDPALYERSNWKPYMAALNSFRSDDVILNSIDIESYGPSYSFRNGEWTEVQREQPNRYTETSECHVHVTDSQGDPVEGACVMVYRIGHNIYEPTQQNYPHFAYANYTNDTGSCVFHLGLQGECPRCDNDHAYAVEVLSHQGNKPLSEIDMVVPEENQVYHFNYQISGDAPRVTGTVLGDRKVVGEPELREMFQLQVEGLQRHSRGEFGGHEQFTFGTSFDHVFDATIDCLLLNETQLMAEAQGGPVDYHDRAMDVSGPLVTFDAPGDEDSYLVLSNRDSYGTTKVVSIATDLWALCGPRLSLTSPVAPCDHSSDEPLVVSGTLWDRVPLTALEVSLDGGGNWTDAMGNYSAGNRSFSLELDVSSFTSGDITLQVRATDDVGITNGLEVPVYLDAQDPVLTFTDTEDGVYPGASDVPIAGNVTDDRELAILRARMGRDDWTVIELPSPAGGDFSAAVPAGENVGEVELEVEAVDGVGRSTMDSVTVFIDIMAPDIEVTSPDPTRTQLLGDVGELEVMGHLWDDHGIPEDGLSFRVDGGPWSIAEPLTSFLVTVPLADLADGEHTVELLAKDLADHTAEASVAFVLDTTAPHLSLEEVRAEYDDSQDVTLSGVVTDEHDVQVVSISVDGGAEVYLGVDALGGFTHQLPSGPQAVGYHYLVVRAVDELDNSGEVRLGYAVFDESSPTISLDEPAQNAEVPRGTELRLSGSASDNVGVASLWLDSGEGPVNITPSLDPRFDEWSTTLDTSGMELGRLVIDVTIRDDAGNEAFVTVLVRIVDRTRPEVSIDPVSQNVAVRTGRELSLVGNMSDDEGVDRLEYRLDFLFWVPVPTTVTSGRYTFVVPTGGLEVGSHTLEVRVTDAARNQRTASTFFEVEAEPETGLSAAVIGGVVAAVVVAVLVLFLLMSRRRRAATDGAVPTEPETTPEEEPSPLPEGEPPATAQEELPGTSGEEPSADTDEGPSADTDEEPSADTDEGPPADAEEGPPADAEEGPPADAEEGPPADAEEGPPADAEEGPPADADEGPPADAEEGPPVTPEGEGAPTDAGDGEAAPEEEVSEEGDVADEEGDKDKT